MRISVCIPVYNGEGYILQCLESLDRQTFRDFEVIVVDDCSPGKDERGWSLKKICRKTGPQWGFPLRYVRQPTNLGSLEARRTATLEATGDYVLFVDCDDTLEPEALERLAAVAGRTDADIIQCGVTPVTDVTDGSVDLAGVEGASNLLVDGHLSGSAILDAVAVTGEISTFIWAKLMRRAMLLTAWEHIPPMYGVWGEDYLMMFVFAYHARTYFGFRDRLYRYSLDTGISATKMVADLEKWEKFCAVTSVFSAIFMQHEDGVFQLSETQYEAVRMKCDMMVTTNLYYLDHFVDESIRDEARAMLTEYSGEKYLADLARLHLTPRG